MLGNTAKKEPWLAVNLSLFFPGMGQLYAGKFYKGSSLFLAQIGLVLYSLWSIYSPRGNTVDAIFCLCILVIVYIFNLIDAYYCLKLNKEIKSNQNKKNPWYIFKNQQSPWYVFFLSRLFPGLGHIYLRKPISAVFFITSTIIFGLLDDSRPSLLIIPPIITAISARHAYFNFPKLNYDNRQKYYVSRSLLALMTGLIFILGVTNTCIPNWIEHKVDRFVIPSSSMFPTLQVDDQIFVAKSSNYQPEFGDILVFTETKLAQKIDPNSVSGETHFFVKRVIGLPGQKIKIADGLVYINDFPLVEDYIQEMPYYYMPEHTIPTDSYFVLGDNRNNSFDSHIWGFLPVENIVGKAYKIYWPPKNIQAL